MPPRFCLQTKEGEAARGLTAQEFAARATAIHAVAHKLYAANPAAWGYQLRFSWDHCSAHEAARDDIDLLPEQVLDRPARSPDTHRVVETPHSLLHSKFKERLSRNPRIKDVTDAIRLLKQVAKDVCTPKYIQHLCADDV